MIITIIFVYLLTGFIYSLREIKKPASERDRWAGTSKVSLFVLHTILWPFPIFSNSESKGKLTRLLLPIIILVVILIIF